MYVALLNAFNIFSHLHKFKLLKTTFLFLLYIGIDLFLLQSIIQYNVYILQQSVYFCDYAEFPCELTDEATSVNCSNQIIIGYTPRVYPTQASIELILILPFVEVKLFYLQERKGHLEFFKNLTVCMVDYPPNTRTFLNFF